MISIRRHGDRDLSDEGILGNGHFVERIIEEADDGIKRQLPENSREKRIVEIMQEVCDSMGVNIKEVGLGSRRRFVCEARRIFVRRLVQD